MKRLLFVLCALLVPSAARAERIEITGVAATYWTATDELVVNVWFDSPLVIPQDYFAFMGKVRSDFAISGFYFRSDGIFGRERLDPFYVVHFDSDARGYMVEAVPTGLPNVVIDGRSLTVTMPFAMTGLDTPQFDFLASVIRNFKSHGLDGSSSVDRRVFYTPEPSSLASLGGMALLVHLVRRPGPGILRPKRH